MWAIRESGNNCCRGSPAADITMDELVKDDALVVLKIVVESLVELTVPVPARVNVGDFGEITLYTSKWFKETVWVCLRFFQVAGGIAKVGLTLASASHFNNRYGCKRKIARRSLRQCPRHHNFRCYFRVDGPHEMSWNERLILGAKPTLGTNHTTSSSLFLGNITGKKQNL